MDKKDLEKGLSKQKRALLGMLIKMTLVDGKSTEFGLVNRYRVDHPGGKMWA